MNVPSLNEIAGMIAAAILLALVSGHGDLVWNGLNDLRRVAMTNARQDWGCPSLTGNSACTSYDPARYR